MAESSTTGLLDLEKELNCSICTEVLYQPLTLLDCLHTFCGSCLKLWFAWQALRAADYSCPSCRAVVRGTRPDAKITTLLDMFLQANPDKKKTEEEKKDIATKYTPGDNVIPPQPAQEEDEDDEVDRRMIDEVREMSLRDGGQSRRTYERGHRHRQRSRETRNGQGLGPGRSSGNRSTASAESRSQARHIEHQSSLRSLISTDDVDSTEMEEEILRQILEDGLLDGIDLQSMSFGQEDELSERIAEAYRRRHSRRGLPRDTGNRETREARRSTGSGSRPISREGQSSPRQGHSSPRQGHSSPRQGHSSPRQGQSSPRQQPAVPQSSSSPSSAARPSSSRLQVHEARVADSSGRRRSSGERRRQTSPGYLSRQSQTGQTSPSLRSPQQREAARSVTDLTDRASTREGRERRMSDQERRPTRELQWSSRPVGGRRIASNDTPSQPPSTVPRGQSETSIPRAPASGPIQQNFQRITQREMMGGSSRTRTADDSPLIPVPRRDSGHSRPAAPAPIQANLPLYAEPSIACDGCGKTQIQYDLHENCGICKDGKYNLCHRCYRTGKGCPGWYGFGNLAWHRYQRQNVPNTDLPHTLVGHRYPRPKPETHQQPLGAGQIMTSENPADRLQAGAFCSICSTFAGDIFWMCEWCNDGEWGYCNKCVNQGRCCTHPLLPLAHVSAGKTIHLDDADSEASLAPLTSASMVQTFPPTNITQPGQYRPLTFSTNCDVCRYPVQPSQSRYHCYVCAAGNYDICTTCYAKLLDAGRIGRENGDKGWRRCLRGHRMIVFYFEDSPVGQRRVVVRDLVGGHFLRDDAHGAASVEEPEGHWRWVQDSGEPQTREAPRRRLYKRSGLAADAAPANAPSLQQFPPDGGVGMQLVAVHAWIPAAGVANELSFPRGAEIREAMELSEDWYEGAYAGAKGLFPSKYTKLQGIVQM